MELSDCFVYIPSRTLNRLNNGNKFGSVHNAYKSLLLKCRQSQSAFNVSWSVPVKETLIGVPRLADGKTVFNWGDPILRGLGK